MFAGKRSFATVVFGKVEREFVGSVSVVRPFLFIAANVTIFNYFVAVFAGFTGEFVGIFVFVAIDIILISII